MHSMNRAFAWKATSFRFVARMAVIWVALAVTALWVYPVKAQTGQMQAATGDQTKATTPSQTGKTAGALSPSSVPILPVPSGHTILYYPTQECCQPMTEGEFAIMYAQGLGLPEPPEGWTVQSASAAVSERLGWVPIRRQWNSDGKTYTYTRKGWHLSEYLTEEVFFDGLKASRDPRFDRKPFTNGFDKEDLTARRVQTSDGNFELNYTSGDPNALVRIPKVRSALMQCGCITEGEFAALFAQKIILDPHVRVWTADRAANELLAKCYYPRGGWQLNECLTNEDFYGLLRNTEYELPQTQAVDPRGIVTPLQVYAALEKQPLTTQGELAIFYANRVGLRAPSSGWTADMAIERLQNYGLSPEYGWVECAPGCATDFEKLIKRAALPIQLAALGGQGGQTSCEPLRADVLAALAGSPTGPPPGPPPSPPLTPPASPTTPTP